MRLLLLAGSAAALSMLLAGCSLTATEVEPDLPVTPVNNDNTVIYRANGQPIVAHNYGTLGTILLSFFGDGRAVSGQLQADSTLLIRSEDSQNLPPNGSKTHALSLALPKFRGRGTYLLQTSATTYRELIMPYNPQQAATAPTFTVAPAARAQVTVTAWDAARRQLRGTFAFTVAAAGQAQAIALTDGEFDLVVDQ